MFSHVTVGAKDLHRLASFYDSALAPLGLRQREIAAGGGPAAACRTRAGGALPRFHEYVASDGRPAAPGKRSMVALLARSPGAAREAHAAGLAAGGTDESAPGERPHHGPGYRGACLCDPENNELHVVRRGDAAAN